MPEWQVPLVDVEVDELEIDAVVQTYRSGWLSMGPRTELLEERFAAYVGSRHAIAVTNCTAGLHLICLAAGLGPGDEVIVPSLTFVATVNAIRYTGATPVFADVAGLERPWLSAESASAAAGEQTKAIFNMTYGGHAGESAELAALAADRDLILLEDAAHGLGGSLAGRALGTLGLGGAYSFFANKNLPVGEGGMVVTDDDEVAKRIRLLRSHGMTSLTWDRHRGHASGYDVIELGFNYRIDEPRAAFALERLARLDSDNDRRRAAAGLYRSRLEGLDGVTVTMPDAAGVKQAHHLCTVVLDEDRDRDGARERMAEQGVQTSLHYPPVHRFSDFGEAAELPHTDAYSQRAISLPLFPALSEEQIELVVRSLSEALAER
jgi:dTDP-4-amino-4,6-dideoxygalactose transaminase